MADDLLRTGLLDLHWELRDTGIKLILGGGYGLYLRQLNLQERESYRPLIKQSLWPAPRTTKDIDLFLPAEVIVSETHFREIRAALDRLKYIPKTKFFQFVKALDRDRSIQVDLLTGPIGDEKGLHISRERVRPMTKVELHAHIAKDAIDVENELEALSVKGVRSDATPYVATVHLPKPFTFLVMKLHAFSDRKEDSDMDFGRHHAMDVYRTVAMLDEVAYDAVKRHVAARKDHAVVKSAQAIIGALFQEATSLGSLRFKEHAQYHPAMGTDALINGLRNLFQ